MSPSPVASNNLDVAIYQLRRVLGDEKDPRRFIRAIPKKGYQFLKPVQFVIGKINEHNRLALPEAVDHQLTLSSAATVVSSNIAPERLASLENTGQGNLDDRAEVIVYARQPIEVVDAHLARQVASNLEQAVTYLYFFTFDRIPMIAKLIYSLATAGLADALKWNEQGDDDTATVRKNLQVMAERVRIYIIPQQWPSFEFRIHNAQNRATAKLYLQFQDRHEVIRFYTGEAAFGIAEKLKDETIHLQRESSIIRLSEDCPWPKGATEKLWKHIGSEFNRNLEDVSEIRKMLRRLCIGNWSSEKSTKRRAVGFS